MFQVYDTDLIMSRLKFISIYKYMIQKCSPNPYSPTCRSCMFENQNLELVVGVL